MNEDIKRVLVATAERSSFTEELFGIDFPLKLEPYIFHLTSSQAQNYNGGYWDFYKLSNGGFYMAPDGERYQVSCPNYYRGGTVWRCSGNRQYSLCIQPPEFQRPRAFCQELRKTIPPAERLCGGAL